MVDESGESMELMEEVPLKELGESELERFSARLERSRELITETRGNILEGMIGYS